MEEKIENFIVENKVFTLATSVNHTPYCANCFYAYDKASKILVFLSDNSTRHIIEARENNRIGGSIQNGVTEVPKLQGVQFQGVFIDPSELQKEVFYNLYYEKYPFAKKMPAPVWGIKLAWIKMTDNTKVFGEKLIWENALST